jgi:Ca2+-binding RTX toxin-like protein
MSSKAGVFGTSGDDDIKATNDVDGSYLAGNGGDDILRGGRYNDVLVGGEGDDEMVGGGGADAFVFYGLQSNLGYLKPEADDVDRVRDLTFSQGDKMVISSYAEASANAVIRSWADIVDLVDGSGWEASREGLGNNNLVISYDLGEGVSQTIVITNGWSQYLEASGVSEIPA